ncbi:MAG: NAD(P)(+) transhydrogenase (Re/Si-specific) subunit alpha, partial [Rhodobacteraceae bacterium]|nr:NAD(P)(+) transhydrogenase (Re/Si-specific) subunit alpha [Paracoccaceae bacterium]
MKIGALAEIAEGVARVAMTPTSVTDLKKLGHDCLIQAGAGQAAGSSDAVYAEAGADVVADAAAIFAGAD